MRYISQRTRFASLPPTGCYCPEPPLYQRWDTRRGEFVTVGLAQRLWLALQARWA